MLVALKSWHAMSGRPKITGAIAGVNACVVGFLLAALYDPIFTSAVKDNLDMVLVVIGFALFKLLKPNIFYLVLSFAIAGAVIS